MGEATNNNSELFTPEVDTRDRVISAIYETVIRPELYDSFINAWDKHIQASLAQAKLDDAVAPHQNPDVQLDLFDGDPELKAHFSRAYEILEQIGRKRPPSEIREQIRTAPGVALLLTGDAAVAAASPSAQLLLDRVGSVGAFLENMTAPSRELLSHLFDAAKGADGALAPVVLATGWAPRHMLARLIAATDPHGKTQQLVVIEALEYQWHDQDEAMLVTSFNLSRAEVDIVRNLLAGLSLRQIAEQSGRSEHTIRNQAKAVLAKSGAPGQVDLIRLVVFLINREARKTVARAGDVGLTRDTMRMATGMTLQTLSAGPEGGRPVLFLHGMMDGPAPMSFLRDEFERRNLRVTMLVRPGYGQSTPVARVDQAMALFAGHVAEYIDRKGLVRPVLLGNMGGSVYAHTVASRLGNSIAGFVAAAGGAPITRLSQLSRMARRQRVVAYTARFAPALLPAVLRAGIAQIDSKDIDGFLNALYTPGTQEHAVIQRLALAPRLRAGYRFSVEQGPAGFVTDSHFVVRDWSSEITCQPTRGIYLSGAQDPVVSVDSLLSAMGGRANIDVRIEQTRGQLILYECPDLVLGAVEELFAADEKHR